MISRSSIGASTTKLLTCTGPSSLESLLHAILEASQPLMGSRTSLTLRMGIRLILVNKL